MTTTTTPSAVADAPAVAIIPSWKTPIAWYVIPDPGEAPYWVFVSRYFSKSTSVHQGVVRRGLSRENQSYAVEVVK